MHGDSDGMKWLFMFLDQNLTVHNYVVYIAIMLLPFAFLTACVKYRIFNIATNCYHANLQVNVHAICTDVCMTILKSKKRQNIVIRIVVVFNL